MIVNGLAIGIPVILLAAGCGLVMLLLRRDDGRHAADALFTAAHEVHHAEYTPYDYAPAPPSLHDGYRAALAMNKRAEDEDAGMATLPAWAVQDGDQAPEDTRADGRLARAGHRPPGASPAPDHDGDGPYWIEVTGTGPPRPPYQLPEDPPAGDEDPGPDGLPEGEASDGSLPPQETAGPGDLLAKAAAAIGAVQAIPVSDYIGHLEGTTAWADDGPWNPLSDATLARGMPAIRGL